MFGKVIHFIYFYAGVTSLIVETVLYTFLGGTLCTEIIDDNSSTQRRRIELIFRENPRVYGTVLVTSTYTPAEYHLERSIVIELIFTKIIC